MIHEMSREECHRVLAGAKLARLGCAHENQPYVVPVYLAFHEESRCFYGFTTPGQKVEWMRANPLVSVEADQIEGTEQWVSVVVTGRYEELPDTPEWAGERQLASELLQKNAMWWEPGFAKTILQHKERPLDPVFYRIYVAEITGHRAAP